MPAPEGNQFWKLRSKHGREKIFSDPQTLWDAACEYFQWCDNHPWTTRKATQRTIPAKKKGKKKGEEEEETLTQTYQEITPTQRPYSIGGLCVFLRVSASYWRVFRGRCNDAKEEDYLAVIDNIEEIIRTQQFEGACVGAFNSNIIARTLGLADKQEVDHTTQGKEFKGFGFLPYTPEAEKVK